MLTRIFWFVSGAMFPGLGKTKLSEEVKNTV